MSIGNRLRVLLALMWFAAMTICLHAQESIPACAPYENFALPVEAAGSQKDAATCDSYDFYRGLDRPVNYQKARACAWKQRQQRLADEDIDGYVVAGGSLTLADLYANGLGVEKNLPLAKRFVCEVQGVLRAEAIQAIDKPNPMKGRFELCDYAANTIAMNECFWIESKVNDQKQERAMQRLKSGMTPPQQVAFEHLMVAEKSFIDLHRLEVYQGGTIRVVRTLGSQSILKELFRAEVVKFLRSQWPGTSVTSSKADSVMETEYQRKLVELKNRSSRCLKAKQ